MKDHRIHKEGGDLPPCNGKLDWASLFALEIEVPEDFLDERDLPGVRPKLRS